jgi:hypothetical protein
LFLASVADVVLVASSVSPRTGHPAENPQNVLI